MLLLTRFLFSLKCFYYSNQIRTSRAEKKTKDQEEQINDSLRNLKLGSHLFILDDEEEEEEFNDFPALAQDHQQKIINFISGRDTRQVNNYYDW